MSTIALFVILAVVIGGYYLFSCWCYPRVPYRWCGGKARGIPSSAARSASARTAAARAGARGGAPG